MSSRINFELLPNSALIRQRDLLPILPFSAATLWRRVGTGQFPKPLPLGGGITAWRWHDVRLWLDAQSHVGKS